jgi:hypothetical protein
VYTLSGRNCATGGAQATRLFSYGSFHAVRYCPHRVLISRALPAGTIAAPAPTTWQLEADPFASGASVTVGSWKYAAIDGTATAAASGSGGSLCQTRVARIPVGWSLAPATATTRDAVSSLRSRAGFGTRCLALADGTAVRVGTAAPCGNAALVSHGSVYAAVARCDMRVLIRTAAAATSDSVVSPPGNPELCVLANPSSGTPAAYATLTLPAGRVTGLTLRRVSGEIRCNANDTSALARGTYWGCDPASGSPAATSTSANAGIVVTMANQALVYPLARASVSGSLYSLPGGLNPAAAELNLNLDTTLSSTTSLRLFFADALYRVSIDDNAGQACFNVRARYAEAEAAPPASAALSTLAMFGAAEAAGGCSGSVIRNEVAGTALTAGLVGTATVSAQDGFTGPGFHFPTGTSGGAVAIAEASDTRLAFKVTASFAVSAWIKVAPAAAVATSRQTTTARMMAIASRMDTGAGGTRGWLFAVRRDGGLEVSLRNAATAAAKRLAHVATGPSVTIATGVWTHVAFTYTGTTRASGVAIYVNGRRADTDARILYDTLTEETPIDAAAGVAASIGARGGVAGTAGLSFEGTIDEVTIMSGAATEAQMEAIYAAGLAGYAPARCSASAPAAAVSAARASVGCADATREALADAAAYPDLAACAAAFAVPGVATGAGALPACARAAGNNGPLNAAGGFPCSSEDACAVGWHVCASHAEVTARGGLAACSKVATDAPAMFFATRQRAGDGASGCSDTEGRNGVYGCGKGMGEASCGPLGARCGIAEAAACPTTWRFGPNPRMESVAVFNPDAAGGGVMCCRDVPTGGGSGTATPSATAAPSATVTATPTVTPVANSTTNSSNTSTSTNGTSDGNSTNSSARTWAEEGRYQFTVRSRATTAQQQMEQQQQQQHHFSVRQANDTNGSNTTTNGTNSTSSATPTPTPTPSAVASATPAPSTAPGTATLAAPTVATVGTTSLVARWEAYPAATKYTLFLNTLPVGAEAGTNASSGAAGTLTAVRELDASAGVFSAVVTGLASGRAFNLHVRATVAGGTTVVSGNSPRVYTQPQTRCEFGCASGSTGRCFFVTALSAPATRDAAAAVCAARYGAKAADLTTASFGPVNALSFRGEAWVGTWAGGAASTCTSMNLAGSGASASVQACANVTRSAVVCEVTDTCRRDRTSATGSGALAVVGGKCRGGMQTTLVASSHGTANYTNAAAHCRTSHGGALATITDGETQAAAVALAGAAPLWIARWATVAAPDATVSVSCPAIVGASPGTYPCASSLGVLCAVTTPCGEAAAYELRLDLDISAFGSAALGAQLSRQASNLGLDADHVTASGLRTGSVILTTLVSPPGASATTGSAAGDSATTASVADLDRSARGLLAYSELTSPGSMLLNPAAILAADAFANAVSLAGVPAQTTVNASATPPEGGDNPGFLLAGDPGIATAADVPISGVVPSSPVPSAGTTRACFYLGGLFIILFDFGFGFGFFPFPKCSCYLFLFFYQSQYFDSQRPRPRARWRLRPTAAAVATAVRSPRV